MGLITLALNELYGAIHKQETAHPEAEFLVGGDFNAGWLKTFLPPFYQHISCATRGAKTLDHFYSTHKNALFLLPFDKSDHDCILLLPVYKQKLKQEVPVMCSIRKWVDDADTWLQDCFTSTAWDIFWDSSDNIEEFTTTVTGFINKCIRQCCPHSDYKNTSKSKTMHYRQHTCWVEFLYYLWQDIKHAIGGRWNHIAPAMTLVICGRVCRR
jgi:hypothetical protein